MRRPALRERSASGAAAVGRIKAAGALLLLNLRPHSSPADPENTAFINGLDEDSHLVS